MTNDRIKLISLFSGSKGNCTLIDTGKIKILIDCGGTEKAIEKSLAALGISLDEIKAIFITHEHCDHTHGLPVLVKKHPIPIHITEKSACRLGDDIRSVISDCMITHGDEFSVILPDGTEISSFVTPHDSVRCVGYKVTNGRGSVGIATDLGYVTQHVFDMLRGCGAVMIEANHDREMVRNGCYPEHLKSRILSDGGHLSNDDCAEICGALARNGTKAFLLSHLSKENNTPESAFAAVTKSVSEYGVSVQVASPDEITVME